MSQTTSVRRRPGQRFARRPVLPLVPEVRQPLRVGFLSAHNYLDRTQWSGTLFYMQQALAQQGLQVVHLGTPRQYPNWQRKLIYYGQNLKKIFVTPPFHPPIQPEWLNRVEAQIAAAECDFVLAPIASKEIAALHTDTPIIYFSDTTAKLFCQEQSYAHVYGSQTRLDQETLDQIELLDAIALTKSTHVVYPSQWAAQSAIEDYGVSPARVSVIPFGANLEQPPDALEVLRDRQSLPLSPCRLLFIGIDWQRKGGDIAFQTLLALLKQGIDAELTIVGAVPPPQIRHERLTVIPRLDKNLPQDRQQLDQLLRQSHFLLLPSRAECYGVSLCEANAFGLPALATAVGGISTVVRNGRNGYKLPLSASGEDYAHLLVKLLADYPRYQQLARSSRAQYDQRLNWSRWAESVEELLRSLG
jgi:glycosyltransferase involved in cell wall biosynthesis